MHIHWKRTLTVFSLAGLGVLLLALRPAMLSNQMEAPDALSVSYPKHIPDFPTPKTLDATLSWDVAQQLENALYCYAKEGSNPFPQLQSALVELQIKQDAQSLQLAITPHKITTRSALDQAEMQFTTAYAGARHRFNAQREPELLFEVQIVCTLKMQRAFFAPSGVGYLIVNLMIDPSRGTLDVVQPRYYGLDRYQYELVSSEGSTFDFPQRWSGQGSVRQLRMIADELMQLDYPRQATRVASELAARCRAIATALPHPQSDWPQSWGDDAAEAQEIRRSLEATLALFAETQYMESEALAELIRSEDFQKIFGATPR